MSFIPPGQLKNVTGSSDLATLCQYNFEALSSQVLIEGATPVNGAANALIGPPTTGARVLEEKWRDSLGGEWRCIAAGTPGTWVQTRPALVAANPGTGTIPVGYRILRTDLNYRERRHTGAYAWADVYGSAEDTTSLSGRMTTAEGEIDALQAADVVHTGRLDGLDADVTALDAADIALDGRLDTAEAEIDALQAEDVVLDGRLDLLEPPVARFTLTALTGGAAGSLDGLVSTALAVNTTRAFVLTAGVLYGYYLVAGTDAENSPSVIRPDDYNAGTNAKVWKLAGVRFDRIDVTDRATSRNNLRVIDRDDSWAVAASRAPKGGIWCDGAVSDRVSGYAGLNIGTSHFSIAFTFALSSYTGTAVTFFKTHQTGNNRFLLALEATGQFTLQFRDASGVLIAFLLTLDVPLVAGETYNGVFTLDRGGNATAFINAESDRDYSGAGVAVAINTASAINIGNGNSNIWTGLSAFSGVVYEWRLYNRLLTASEAKKLIKTGVVDFADQGASLTKIVSGSTLNGNFETLGAGGGDTFASWTETVGGTSTVEAESGADKYSGTYSCKWVIDGSNSVVQLTQALLLTVGKRYRLSLWAKADSVTGAPAIRSVSGVSTDFAVLTTSWAQYVHEFVATTTTLQIARSGSAAGRTIWIDEVELGPAGCFQNLVFDVGVGTHIPCRAGNYPGLLASTTGARHLLPKLFGEFVVQRTYAHGEIGTSGAPTRHLDLPPNAAILDIVANVTTAFDGGTALDVGITGTAAKFASAMALGAIANVYADSLNKAGESPTAFTSVFLQKSAGTSVGQVTIRVRYTLRGI